MNKESKSSEKMFRDTFSFLVKISNDHQNKSGAIDNIQTKKEGTLEYIFVENENVIFSIEGLYFHLKHSDCLSYNQYRRMLYASQLNYKLKQENLKIINYNNDPSIKANLYCLVVVAH